MSVQVKLFKHPGMGGKLNLRHAQTIAAISLTKKIVKISSKDV